MPAKLKRLVRARMEQTGESYQTALRNVRAAERPATGAEFVAAAQQAIEPRSDDEIREIIADIERR